MARDREKRHPSHATRHLPYLHYFGCGYAALGFRRRIVTSNTYLDEVYDLFVL